MMKIISCILFISCVHSLPNYNFNPYQGYGLFNYASQPLYSTYIPGFPEPDLNFYFSHHHQPLNIIPEPAKMIGNTFSVLPMFAIPQNNMNFVTNNAHILGASQDLPMLTVETKENSSLQCVPGVRIELEQPMWIYATRKTSIFFPTDVLIYHGGYKIPFKVGAVLAPVTQESFIYDRIPVEIRVVYAVPVPSGPIAMESVPSIPEVTNLDYPISNEEFSVVVDGNLNGPQNTNPEIFSPHNVTILEFPNSIATPTLQVDGEDEELVNRNPPQFLAPSGIVQSSQPEIHVETFHNSKESPVLTELKIESLKQKLRTRNAEESKTLAEDENAPGKEEKTD